MVIRTIPRVSYKVLTLALASVVVILIHYIGTNWRKEIKDRMILRIFDFFVLWIFINYFRSLLEVNNLESFKEFLFGEYTGLSMFPVLFLALGVNHKNFSFINKTLFLYIIIAAIVSLHFLRYFELAIFLTMPIFYIIITIPWQSRLRIILILCVTIIVLFVSFTNRAGVIRIFFSLLIVLSYYIISKLKINQKLLNIIIACMLLLPFYFLYLGIHGDNIFQILSGDQSQGYGQEVITADTRTFLYFEVFQDLIYSKSLILGKGLNAGYFSMAFRLFNRTTVEVGFLQILLKTGIVGFAFYCILIFSAIFKALRKSQNYFIKSLGLLLSGYFILFFLENILAFNLLNIIVWFAVGMCYSDKLRNMNDAEIRKLFI